MSMPASHDAPGNDRMRSGDQIWSGMAEPSRVTRQDLPMNENAPCPQQLHCTSHLETASASNTEDNGY
jgi:hypothetical protein